MRIEASRPATANVNITQHLVRIPLSEPKAKRMALRALIDAAEVKNGIVFCNRKTEVDVVAKSLKAHGYDAAAIHGDLDQSLRTKTLESFRNGELKLLVASDVAARGLDIPAVSHVFNYDVPHHADDYVHRIGRTGRAGRSGEALMIITPADSRSLDKVLKLIGQAPAETVLELDWSLAAGGDGESRGGRSRSSRDSGRDSGRERGERSGRTRSSTRERPARAEHATAPVEAIQTGEVEQAAPVIAPAAAAPVAATPAEARPARAPRPRREAPAAPVAREPREPREARPAREHRESREPREQREPREDGGRKVLGFGDDTPAFLLRPVRTAALGED